MKMECLLKIERNWNVKTTDKKAQTILFSLIVFITACSNSFCDNLTESIESQCKINEDSCYVTIGEVFPFEWDSLYIFDSMLYPKEISLELGFNCKCDIVPEGKRLVVFTKDGKAVKKYISECSSISFVKMRKNGVVKLHNSSSFLLKKKLINNRIHYFLYALAAARVP